MKRKLNEVPQVIWNILWNARVDFMQTQGYLECDAARIADAEIDARKEIAEGSPAAALLVPMRVVWTFEDDLQLAFDWPKAGLSMIKVPSSEDWEEMLD